MGLCRGSNFQILPGVWVPQLAKSGVATKAPAGPQDVIPPYFLGYKHQYDYLATLVASLF